MASGSTTGNIFKITTWGESHGKAIGVVVDGCPAGLSLCEEEIQVFLDRRKPGQSKFTTQRKEEDTVEILSGVFEGKTTGTPISMMIRNKDQRSKDYGNIAEMYRPGHADYTFDEKFGFRDYRGGGRSSARETAARVAAGAVAVKVLKELGIDVFAFTKSIGEILCKEESFDRDYIQKNQLFMPDGEAVEKAEEYLSSMIEQKDSAGGVIECQIHGMPAGIGEPVFDKLSARLAGAVFSIGAVKGFEIGEGFHTSKMCGSVHNDSFYYDEEGRLCKETNHAGGILGGMSDGSPIVLRAAFKPTPSIGSVQKTVNKSGENIEAVIKGRHDPIVVPRAVVVVEAMTAITVLDLLLTSMTSRMDLVKDFFASKR